MLRERERGGFADVANPECIEKPRQSRALRRLDRGDELLRRFLSHAFELGELLRH